MTFGEDVARFVLVVGEGLGGKRERDMEEMAYRVRVPRTFVEDHARRDLLDLEAVTVRATRSHYVLELTRRQLLELRSDCDYYVDGGTDEFGREYFGLISSARATMAAIDKLGEVTR